MMDLTDRKFPKNKPEELLQWIRRDKCELEYYIGKKENMIRQGNLDEDLHAELRWNIDQDACAVAAWYGELGGYLDKQFEYRLQGVRHGGACKDCFDAARKALLEMYKQKQINDEKALWLGLDLYHAVLDAKKEWKGKIRMAEVGLEDILPAEVKIPEEIRNQCKPQQ